MASLAGCAGLARGAVELVVEDATAGRILHRERVRPGETFTLSYVHSLEHVPVRGVFRVEPDGSLLVVETAFAGFGPGLPELRAGEAWRVERGMIVVPDPGVRLPEVAVRVAPFTHHRLRAPSGTELDLSSLMRAGGLVRITIAEPSSPVGALGRD